MARSLCELDRPSEAKELLDENLLRLDTVVPHHWLTAALAWADVAVGTNHTTAASILRARLIPYAEQICFNACWVEGSVAHALGLLSAALGQPGEAERWFRDAERAHRRLEAPLLFARTRVAREHFRLDVART